MIKLLLPVFFSIILASGFDACAASFDVSNDQKFAAYKKSITVGRTCAVASSIIASVVFNAELTKQQQSNMRVRCLGSIVVGFFASSLTFLSVCNRVQKKELQKFVAENNADRENFIADLQFELDKLSNLYLPGCDSATNSEIGEGRKKVLNLFQNNIGLFERVGFEKILNILHLFQNHEQMQIDINKDWASIAVSKKGPNLLRNLHDYVINSEYDSLRMLYNR